MTNQLTYLYWGVCEFYLSILGLKFLGRLYPSMKILQNVGFPTYDEQLPAPDGTVSYYWLENCPGELVR